MKLFFAPPSPYSRKVRALILEKGMQDQVELIQRAPFERPADLLAINPLCKVPTLITNDGQTLFDSPVICEFIDNAGPPRLIPSESRSRWQALRFQALADGLLDAGSTARLESRRSESERSASWIDRQMETISRSLDVLEREITSLGEHVTIGHIAVGCALGWLEFRFPDFDWRAGHDKLAAWFISFSERPSMIATKPA